jgi:trimethylamine corrinoid protein
MRIATEVINTAIPKSEQQRKGKIVIGTVEGDIHDIGKTIVVSLLKANGFEVYDLGRDIPTEKFIEKADEVGADIIGTSALLTTTMEGQRKLEAALKGKGLKGKYQTMVGGAPVTQRWADRIGADAYAEDAGEAVKKAKQLLGIH